MIPFSIHFLSRLLPLSQAPAEVATTIMKKKRKVDLSLLLIHPVTIYFLFNFSYFNEFLGNMRGISMQGTLEIK